MSHNNIQDWISVISNVQMMFVIPYSISKMDLKEIGCEGGRWMELAQDHVQ
jgi:hypothetical protein